MNYPGILIQAGSNRPDEIKLIKQRLNQLNFGPLDENNLSFGPNTEQAVKQFQIENQLNDDGVVGRLTWERLFNGRTELLPSSSLLKVRALEYAETQLFVREKTGHNDGTEVEKYLASVGLDKGYSWCAAFVYWCFQKAAKDLSIRNPLPQTGGVLDHLHKTKGKIIYSNPEPGDIFIMDFGQGKGHTGIVRDIKSGEDIYTIEGNTNGGGSREGDGVYERNRLSSSIVCYISYSQITPV